LTAVKVQGVISNAIGMLTSSIDVLARMLTGEPGYYGTDRGCGAPGRRSWYRMIGQSRVSRMRVYVPATMLSLLAFFTLPAFAVVGPASDGAQWQKHVVMVLSRSGAGSY
jgi:hypothetical protein